MRGRIALFTLMVVLAAYPWAVAQSQYGQPTGPRQPVAGPAFPGGQIDYPPRQTPPGATQPRPAGAPQYPAAQPEALMPRDPTLHRVGPQRTPGAPFTLTPQQQADLDRTLIRWEQQGASVRTFDCGFTRIDYDGVFNTSNQPSAILKGEICYAAPDKGLYQVEGAVVGYRWRNGQAEGGQFVKDQQAERWICNGKSIFEYDFQNKRLVEYRLPPELQEGRALSEGPLPFVFGAKADYLKRRYVLRLVTPPEARGQVWLEAYPKFQADAANFQRATLILTESTMQPFALETVSPNGKSRTVYHFDRPRVNARNPLDLLGVFENNWLNARTPRGWTKVVEGGTQPQAQRPLVPDRTR